MSRTRKASGLAALCWVLTLCVLTPSAQANGYRQLYAFQGGMDGLNPQFPLVKYKGNFYGTTDYGGAYGYGNIFALTRQQGGGWSLTGLYSFTGGTDGAFPTGIIVDGSGNIYGTASGGGSGGCTGYAGPGCGTVFEFANGALTVLYAFQGAPNDGNLPNAAVAMDRHGNLFGTTAAGGGGNCAFLGLSGCGTVFAMMPQQGGGWTEAPIYSFQGGTTDGAAPFGPVITDASGNLYGTTLAGGIVGGTGPCNSYGDPGCGTVFELMPQQNGGWSENVLYYFCSRRDCTDGAEPNTEELLLKNGNLYGTTYDGGKDNCCGTVFELASQEQGGWSESVVYSFCSRKHCADGYGPVAGLIADASGNLYSTTSEGGRYFGGTLFKLAPDGTETVLHSFAAGSDGESPNGVIQDKSGNLYGTAYAGGPNNAGTVFRVRE